MNRSYPADGVLPVRRSPGVRFLLAAAFASLALASTAGAQASCSGPPAPVLHGTYGACTSVTSGNTCPLTCDPGYTKSGVEQTCQSGVYVGTAPTCDPNSCGLPAPVTNGSFTNCASGNIASGTTCVLSCVPGATKSGTDPTCFLGSYTGGGQSCTPNSCSPPAPVANGTFPDCTGPSVPSGTTCTLSCPGYTISGTNPTCEFGAYTGGGQTCSPNPCSGPPSAVAHGSYAACTSVASGSTCPLTCDVGYTREGSLPTCFLGAYSGGSATCAPNACSFPPAPVAHGSYASCPSVNSGDSCPLTCDPGYTKSGSEQTCTLGVYTGGAPTCDASSCTESPTATDHGSYAACNGTAVGGPCPLTCDVGYTKSGANPTCVGGSAWNGAPTCVPNACSFPPAPVANGSYASCSSVNSGDSCPLTCDPGYTKSGTEQACTLGVYTGPAPSCTANATTTTITSTTMAPPPCAPSPAAGCRLVDDGSSTALIRDRTPDSGDVFQWKWFKGGATDVASFGSPVAGPGEYRICIYDASAASQPVAELVVEAASTCGDDPCWSAMGTNGFAYKDRLAASSGVAQLKLMAPAADRGLVQLKAKGEALPTPSLPLTSPVTVQLVVGDGATSSACWQAVYASPKTNSASMFKAGLP